MKHILPITLCLILVACTPAATSTPSPIPPELSIEEHALTQRPEAEYTQLYFVEGTQESILAKHAEERSQIITFMDRSCNVDNHFGQCATLGADQLAAWADDTSGLFDPITVTLTRNGRKIYSLSVGDGGSAIPALWGLWTYGDHWALETAHITTHQKGNTIWGDAVGQISIDGKLLNKQYGYQEAFGFQTMHGKPFYFFKRHGKIGVSYNGVEIPLGYSEVLHYGCCSGATLNPRAAQNMVAYFARKGNTWYYVEIGVFGQTAP